MILGPADDSKSSSGRLLLPLASQVEAQEEDGEEEEEDVHQTTCLAVIGETSRGEVCTSDLPLFCVALLRS